MPDRASGDSWRCRGSDACLAAPPVGTHRSSVRRVYTRWGSPRSATDRPGTSAGGAARHVTAVIGRSRAALTDVLVILALN
jgi:hypothetical protein